MPITIRPLMQFDPADLRRLIAGYVSDAVFRVSRVESAQRISLTLELTPLSDPYRKRYDHLDAETLEQYRRVLTCGFSFAAVDGDLIVGIALAEPHPWNRSLWVWELHVAETHRRRGIGRQLVEALAEKGRAAGLRVIVCETQNTDVPAIHFYRSVGFQLEGVDLSYYTNDDFPNGEIAVFMKKRLA
jgi:streptothricin acetyltransferase